MAKREDRKKGGKGEGSRATAVRAAVDQAFQATADQAEGTQRRVHEIAEELTSVAGRLREALDGARPATATDVDALRGDITALAARVAALEKALAKPAARKPPARRAAAKDTPAKSAAAKDAAAKSAPARQGAAAKGTRSATAASKVPAARAAARRSAGQRPA